MILSLEDPIEPKHITWGIINSNILHKLHSSRRRLRNLRERRRTCGEHQSVYLECTRVEKVAKLTHNNDSSISN